MIIFGLCSRARRFHLLVVDVFLLGQAVGDDVEPFARHVQRHAVGQVAAFGQRHAHDGVARLQHGEEHALVGLRARVRLHVGGFGAEQLLDAVDRQLLGDVDVFAAAVVALARIAFGILVRQLGALRLHHGRRGVVLGRDQLDVILLAGVFLLDGIPQFRVDVGERVIFCKHEKTPIDKSNQATAALDRRGRGCSRQPHTNMRTSRRLPRRTADEISRSPVVPTFAACAAGFSPVT
jgi:hypothetical protein